MINMVKKKRYVVDIDRKYSRSIVVQAENKPEAKKIAFMKFISKDKIKYYNVYAEQEDN